MKYARSVLITLLSKGLAIPIGILASVITARYLGPSGRGVLVVLAVIQGLAIQFGSFGFNASITFFISRDPSSTDRIVSNTIVTALTGAVALCAVLFLSALFVPKALLGTVDPSHFYIALVAIPFVLGTQLLQNVFIARQMTYDFNLLDLVGRFLQLVGFIILLAAMGLGTTEAVWCITIAAILTSFVTLVRLSRVARIRLQFDPILFRSMVRYGMRTYVASFLMFLVMRSNIIFINYFLGEWDSGIFSVVLQFIDLIYLIPTTLGLILFPKVSMDKNDNGELTAKVFRFSLLAIGTLLVVLSIFAQSTIRILFGEQFLGAVVPFYVLAPGLLALSLVTILNNDLAARGLPSVVIFAPAIGLAVNVMTTLLFVKTLGIVASALALSISYVCILVILYLYFVRISNMSFRKMFLFTVADLRSIRLTETRS